MKITAMATMMMLLCAVAYGESTATERKVTVCFEDHAGAWRTVPAAQYLASQIFAGIGVTFEWRSGLRNCPNSALIISLRENEPATLKRGVLAYALPYEGSHIEVFYARIAEGLEPDPHMISILLAHVLVHEITHILQGISRHSEDGIMKAHWSDRDHSLMRHKALRFTPTDVDMINNGLKTRASRALVAMNTSHAPVAGQ